MTVETQQWLKRVDEALLALEKRPQFTLPAEFPMQAVEALLQKQLRMPQLKLSVQGKGWLAPQDVWKGMGESRLPVALAMTPLEPPLYLVLHREDLQVLMGEALGGDLAAAPFFDEALAEGFAHYLILEVIRSVVQAGFAAPLSPHLLPTPQLEMQTPALVYDLCCTCGSHQMWGRLLISDAFRQAWTSLFAETMRPTRDSRWQEIDVEVSIDVGTTELRLDEWQRVRPGDVVLLDHCLYDPRHAKGSAILSLGGRPLFRGRFQEESLQLLEFPHEVLGESMEEEVDNPEPPTVEIDALPINLTVEVSRLKMTVQELSQLSVGSILTLDQSPQAGVTLLVNGKRVGRGELVAVGEALGVRIVSL